MTTISQIISDAYRETNLTAVGVDPTSAEQTEALRLLNRVILALFGYELGEPLYPMALGQGNIDTPDNVPRYMDDIIEFYPPENTRLQCNLESAKTINLPPQPRDGSRFAVVDNSGNFSTYNLTINGNGRLIEGADSIVLNTSGEQSQWFYREDTGNWAKLATLAIDDDSPFPEEFDDFLILKLALRINTRNGSALNPESQLILQQSVNKFVSRYRQVVEIPSEQALVRLPSNRLFRPYYGQSSYNFQRGLPIW